jgi:membrane-associated HD superfamily phosphohydrolase
MGSMYINHLAVAVSALSSLVVGGIWYSPLLFSRAWQKECGLSNDQLKQANRFKIFGITLLLAVLMSYNLAFFLGDSKTDWQWGLTAGFLAGFGWSTLSLTVISLFELRSFRYILINGGYITVWFSLIGLILGAWR